MRVLVVGAGMYVTGRGTDSLGTVLPAIAEYSRSHEVERVTVCATREEGREETELATSLTNERLGTSLSCEYRIADVVLEHAGPQTYDCAIVSVPDHLHFEIAAPLVSAGVHVQVVKPLTASVAEARTLIELAAARRVHGVVEFHKRLDPQNLTVKRLIASGSLGELAYATVDFSQRIDIPTRLFRGWAHRTNVFQYLGVHYVDLLHYLTGLHPTAVMAKGRHGILQDLGVDAFDSIHALLLWTDPRDTRGREFVSQFTVNWIDPERSSAMSDQRYRLVGARGRLEVDQKHRGLELVTTEQGVVHVNPHFSQFLPTDAGVSRFAGYGAESVIQFLDDVRGLREGRHTVEQLAPHRPTFSDALVSTKVIEAANRSMEERGSWVGIQ